MKTPIAALGLALAAGHEIATTYEPGRSVRVETQTALTMETVDFSMERGGEPVEGRFGRGGGGGVDLERSAVWVDTVVAAADGAPRVVRRAFEEAESRTLFGTGEDSRERDRESPLVDVTLELTADEDGDVTVAVVDGAEPDDACLVGHRLALALDALLPDGEVAEGDSWDLDGDAVLAALGLDVAEALFPREEREWGGDGDGGGRRRRFGGRRGGGGAEREMAGVDWDARATLEDAAAEFDGLAAYRIAIELEGEGSTDEDGRESEIEVRLEGALYWSPELGLPLFFEVEGEVLTDSRREFDRGDGLTVVTSSQAGEYVRRVAVSVTETEE